MRPLILPLLLLALPAGAQNIGESFRCPGPDGLPDVLATIGRTDMASELLGEPVTPDTMILHLQLAPDTPDRPLVPHAPFDEAALAECTPEDDAPFERIPFAEGLDAYQAEVAAGDAGFFQIPPAEAYWLTIGVLDQNGG